ncbi:MAG: polysaccharide deacetylase family protein [Solirubrobacteraceae bacterium]
MKDDLLILCYHAVSECWPAPLSVTPERLAHQMGTLVARGYRGATFTEAVTRPSGGRVVAVTFDDAYRSVLTGAFPILSALGLVATVFVPTDFIDDEGRKLSWPGIDEWSCGDYDHELTAMSWDELEGLTTEGWEMGSHTRSHPRLTTLGDERLLSELEVSRRTLESRFGRGCSSLAYPYGDYDARVAAAAGQAGYVAAATLPRRLHRPSPLAWPRVGIYHNDHAQRYRLKVFKPGRMLRGSPLWRR